MDGCIDIILHKAFTHDDSILVVVAVPCHEADYYVSAECHFTVVHGRTIGKYFTFGYDIARRYDRLLVIARSRVGTYEFGHLVYIFFSFCLFAVLFFDAAYMHFIGGYVFYTAHEARDDCCAGMTCCNVLHAGTDMREFRNQERYSLTLHVRPHESTVGVIVLEERDERRRCRYYLLR